MRVAAIAVLACLAGSPLAACASAPPVHPDETTLAGRFRLARHDHVGERVVRGWLGDGEPYTLECRARICRLVAVELGTPAYVALRHRLTPERRPLRDADRVGNVIYFELDADDVAAAKAELAALPATFRASPAYARCLAEHRERGPLVVRLAWDQRAPVVRSQGELEGSRLDACIQGALLDRLARIHVPRDAAHEAVDIVALPDDPDPIARCRRRVVAAVIDAEAHRGPGVVAVACDGFTATISADCDGRRDHLGHVAALVAGGGKPIRDLGASAVDLSNASSTYVVAADDDSTCLVGIDLPPSQDAAAYMRAALEAVP